MKKIFTFSIIFLLGLIPGVVGATGQDNVTAGLLDANMCITTYTSEPCGVGSETGGFSGGGSDQNQRYACTVCGPDAFITFISSIYKFIFFISLILGVLMIVVMGIGMSISGIGEEDLKVMAKKRIGMIISGLLVMALIPWILKTVAPFFFQ